MECQKGFVAVAHMPPPLHKLKKKTHLVHPFQIRQVLALWRNDGGYGLYIYICIFDPCFLTTCSQVSFKETKLISDVSLCVLIQIAQKTTYQNKQRHSL